MAARRAAGSQMAQPPPPPHGGGPDGREVPVEDGPAAKVEWTRSVSSLPQCGQRMGSVAASMGRRRAKARSQLLQMYS